MGYLYEVASTLPAYAMPAYYNAHPPARSHGPITIPFGKQRLQHCVLWEPAEVRHSMPVFYFHGGGYVFGTPESMIDAANAYNAEGYRFCSVGFRTAPWSKFPAMVDDAFMGTKAAIAWMEANGRPCERVIIGGTSAGGHLAALLCYAAQLQRVYDFPRERVAACVSIAGVADAADLLLKPFPTYGAWHAQVDLNTTDHSRAAMHRAVTRYSPVDLVEKEPEVPHVPLFVVHGRADTLSPYASQVRFVEALRARLGDEAVEFITLEGRRWQHMHTTVTLHKTAVAKNPVLAPLFAWLAHFDES